MFARWIRNAGLLFAVALLGTASTLCFAQFSGNVQGTVTDPKGAVIPGANVTLANQQTGTSVLAKTDNSGVYRFDSLTPGDYSVTVEAPGFERATALRHVSTDETAALNFTLTVGSASTTVDVTSLVTGLNPDETRLEYTLQSQDLDRLPLPDRSTLTALRTAPGVVGIIETTGSTNTNIPIGQPAPDLRANGRPSSSNLYLLDRIPITNNETAGQVNIVPNPDMLAEIALQTTTFSVENGATSSIQVDMTSKSGGNTFHGDLDGSYTSKPFEASPNFGAVTPFHRKYLLGSLGGPILPNKLFFFGSFEHADNSSSLTGLGNGWSSDFANWAKTAFPNSPIANNLFQQLSTNLVLPTPLHHASDWYPATNTGAGGKVPCGTPASYNLPCNIVTDYSGEFNQTPR